VDHVVARSRLARPTGRWQAATAAGVLFVGAFAVLAAAGLAAAISKETLLFPSLGPTAMLFFARPLPPETSVGTTVLAHWIGIVLGFACLVLFGLRDAGSAVSSGVDGMRLAAAALSVAATAAVLRLLRTPHAPAGASTLIVSLGVLTTGRQLAMMAASVVLVALLGWAINLLFGTQVPWWPDRHTSPAQDIGEQLPVPWVPVVTPADGATRLLTLPHLTPGPAREPAPPEQPPYDRSSGR
jgi:hypothetical protein